MMSALRGKDTRPELVLRKILFSMGYRFRLHVKGLPGKPDIVLPRFKKAIFVNGCFWHQHQGCVEGRVPSKNKAFWEKKFESNKSRDERVYKELLNRGWEPLVIWECELKSNKDKFGPFVIEKLGLGLVH